MARIDFIRERAYAVLSAQEAVHEAIRQRESAEIDLLDEVMVEQVAELLSGPPKVRVDNNHRTITIEVKLDF